MTVALEGPRPFARSLLWTLQRRYFDAAGVDAWRYGEVPDRVTCSRTIAHAYARIAFAFRGDHDRLAPSAEPLYVCELGAGSGRFAFHFLTELSRICGRSGVPLSSFRYVLTDVAERNLRFWREHPLFAPFFESGVLDLGYFDVTRSDALSLRTSGETIGPGCLKRPPVVIANYVLDSVPQELFYVDGGRLHDCLVSVTIDGKPDGLDSVEILERARIGYRYEPACERRYDEPELQTLLDGYRATLNDSHLLFPAEALRCIRRLSAFAGGLLLLCADKGHHELEKVAESGLPAITRHGGFSTRVNFHALASYCTRAGGIAFFPDVTPRVLNVGALLLADGAGGYTLTDEAYERYVRDLGPDDLFEIFQHACDGAGELALRGVLAYVRLSRYDSQLFARFLPRLTALAPELDDAERGLLCIAVDRVWDSYFPIGEPRDLAYEIGVLLYGIGHYAHALGYFQRSADLYGAHTGTLYNMAVCHQLLGNTARAADYLRIVIEHDPANEEARERAEQLAHA